MKTVALLFYMVGGEGEKGALSRGELEVRERGGMEVVSQAYGLGSYVAIGQLECRRNSRLALSVHEANRRVLRSYPWLGIASSWSLGRERGNADFQGRIILG